MSNKPTCLTHGHPGIDQGTSCLNRSNAPGPLGADASILSHLRDGISWTFDKTSLELTRAREVIGLLKDVYGGEVGSGYKPIAEAWDRRITNMSNATTEFNRKHQTGANPVFDKATAFVAWWINKDPMKEKLFDYYVYGQGEDYLLTLEEIRLMNTHFDLFDTSAYSKNMQKAIDGALNGHPMPVDTKVSGQNDALGNFTINIKGMVKPVPLVALVTGAETSPYFRNRKAAQTIKPLMFQGMMDWYDDWDFDPKMLKTIEKESGRTMGAELDVDAVAALVDGVPFRVNSDPVAVIQYSGRYPIYG